jgi:cyanophycinase-like exopeptidase
MLVLMGSGETAPTMVDVHRETLSRLAGVNVRILDTPYGFQENADDITRRAQRYFRRSVGVDAAPARLPRPRSASPMRLAATAEQLRRADAIFAGPGSPSYLADQLSGTELVDVLGDAVGSPEAAVLFGSAAAAVAGRFAVPVYEIYKVGADPHWLDGLDLLEPMGLAVAVIPHFDNAEGGTHDTRYAYLGERRLRILEEQLPPHTWILGIDEHTAAILDPPAGTMLVRGRGRITVRHGGRSRTFGAGTRVRLAELSDTAHSLATAPVPAAAPCAGATVGTGRSPLLDAVSACGKEFDRALAARDPLRAAAASLELEETASAWATDTEADDLEAARARIRSMIARLATLAANGAVDRAEIIAPFVDALLEQRDAARGRGYFAAADRIRERLRHAGVSVRDTPAGPRWHSMARARRDGSCPNPENDR